MNGPTLPHHLSIVGMLTFTFSTWFSINLRTILGSNIPRLKTKGFLNLININKISHTFILCVSQASEPQSETIPMHTS